jgi:hypothetical protein
MPFFVHQWGGHATLDLHSGPAPLAAGAHLLLELKDLKRGEFD